MKSLRPTCPGDEAKLRSFLIRVFRAGPHEPFVDPKLLAWKYWEPREDFSGNRSLVVEKDGEITAHVGLWPVQVPVGDEVLRGVHLIDWAADPATPGAGLSLLSRLTNDYDFVYTIGGAEATQRVLPKFGFERVAEAITGARPIRPIRQAVTHQYRDPKSPLRFARNLWWSVAPSERGDGGATLEPSALSITESLVPEREAGFFRWLSRCPAATCQYFDLTLGNGLRGFLALTTVGQQARVAGLWPDGDFDRSAWSQAFQIARRAALDYTGAAELIARSVSPESVEGARLAGLRSRRSRPVFLYQRNRRAWTPPLQFHLCDNDAVIWSGSDAGFLT